MAWAFNTGIFDGSENRWEYTSDKRFVFGGRSIPLSDVSTYVVDIALLKWQTSYVILNLKNGESIKLPVKTKELDQAINLRTLVMLDRY